MPYRGVERIDKQVCLMQLYLQNTLPAAFTKHLGKLHHYSTSETSYYYVCLRHSTMQNIGIQHSCPNLLLLQQNIMQSILLFNHREEVYTELEL